MLPKRAVRYTLLADSPQQPFYALPKIPQISRGRTASRSQLLALSLSFTQVYKGRLKTGEEVAVKVQRPYVLETVTIDLFVLRNIAVWLRQFPKIPTDFVALLDEWAARFFEELDYVREGANGTLFAQQMAADLPQVVVPKTYTDYTSRRVLTTGWISGEKLS